MEEYSRMESAYVAANAYRARVGPILVDAAWMVKEHLGGAVLHALVRGCRSNVDLFRYIDWIDCLEEWRACVASCPWRADMLAEIDAFLAGTAYPEADPDIEPLLLLAVLTRRCSAIWHLVLRLPGPPMHAGLILAHAGAKELLPVLDLLLGACPISAEDTYVIKPLTKPHNLQHTLPVLEAVFGSDVLAHRAASSMRDHYARSHWLV